MKKILTTCSVLLFFCTFCWADLQNNLNGAVQETIPQVESIHKNVDYADIGKTIQFWLFVFVGIIAVAYIIYIGFQLLIAPGSMEELTKATKSLVYIIIGLAIIPFAYFIIEFITNIRL